MLSEVKSMENVRHEMVYTFIDILGFYLVVIGTWRLANATARAPIGAEVFQCHDKEEKYNPVRDLLSPHLVVGWMFKTVLSFGKPGKYTNAVILHKKFNWGLLWLIFGIIVQFASHVLERWAG